jgi:hypothetical protein
MINKTFAKIICILAVIGTVGVIVWANIYSAPYRAVENFFAALSNGDERQFLKYAQNSPDFDTTYAGLCEKSGFSVDEKPDFKVKYERREKHGKKYMIEIVLTVYNDERYTETRMKFAVIQDGFNYKIV